MVPEDPTEKTRICLDFVIYFSKMINVDDGAAVWLCVPIRHGADRKIFHFHLQRGIIAKTEYPGVAKVVSRLIWVQETGRSSRPTRTKAPRSIAPGGFFLVYCGAGFVES